MNLNHMNSKTKFKSEFHKKGYPMRKSLFLSLVAVFALADISQNAQVTSSQSNANERERERKIPHSKLKHKF